MVEFATNQDFDIKVCEIAKEERRLRSMGRLKRMDYFEKELFDLHLQHKCTRFDGDGNMYCGQAGGTKATHFFLKRNEKTGKWGLRCYCDHDTKWLGATWKEDYKEITADEFDVYLMMIA